MCNAFVSGLQQLVAFLASVPRAPLHPLLLLNAFSCSSSVLPDRGAQQVAERGQGSRGGRVVSDSFLPGERNLLLPLSQQQYCPEGSSRPITLPLRILRRAPAPSCFRGHFGFVVHRAWLSAPKSDQGNGHGGCLGVRNARLEMQSVSLSNATAAPLEQKPRL